MAQLEMAVAHQSLTTSPRHLKVTGAGPAFGFEPCEDIGCTVDTNGVAASCGRLACPACGCGGTNLSTIQLVDSLGGVRVRCTCGHAWVRGARPVYVLTRAELAECTCPDACERDHSNE